MFHRALVLEQDSAAAYRVIKALENTGINSITVAASLTEACQSLNRQTHSLALLPLEYLGNPLRILKRIEPKLQFIMLTGRAGNKPYGRLERSILGIVNAADLESELSKILSVAGFGAPLNDSSYRLEDSIGAKEA